MKAENKFITTALLVVVIMFSLVSFKGEKPKTTIVTETLCFVNNNMGTIKIHIDKYCKQGYTVKLITPQSISISSSTYHSERGEVILVLEKQTTVTVK